MAGPHFFNYFLFRKESGLLRTVYRRIGVAAMGGWVSGAAAQTGKAGVDWPAFRGINASGVAEGFATPVQWDVEKKQNVRGERPCRA